MDDTVLITTAEAAAILGVKLDRVRLLAHRGHLTKRGQDRRGAPTGRPWSLYDRGEVEALRDRLTRGAA